ncbi:hypothetical protein [Pseudomonas sp. Tri1]|uniref:hypothetical protein n=1 Tax=Pseudomonas sp. Tri1 TaxID=2823875 RepID=UPI001B334C19|nr:hypothetical protein [Pseudomonas sp. Tri1]
MANSTHRALEIARGKTSKMGEPQILAQSFQGAINKLRTEIHQQQLGKHRRHALFSYDDLMRLTLENCPLPRSRN